MCFHSERISAILDFGNTSLSQYIMVMYILLLVVTFKSIIKAINIFITFEIIYLVNLIQLDLRKGCVLYTGTRYFPRFLSLRKGCVLYMVAYYTRVNTVYHGLSVYGRMKPETPVALSVAVNLLNTGWH